MFAMMLFDAGVHGATPLLLYAAMWCVFWLAIFWRPALAIYLLVPLLPMQTLRYQLQGLPLGDKFVDLLLLSAVVGLAVHRSGASILPATRLNKLLLFYSVFLFAMLWYGSFLLKLRWPLAISDPRFADWKNLAEMPILYLVVTSVITTRKQMVTLMVLMMLTILRANLGFYHTVSGRDFTHFSNSLRYAGVFGYAGQNGLAAFMVEFLILLLAIAPAVKGLAFKLLTWSSILLAAYCVLFSFSRGGYVGALGGLVVLGLMKDRRYLVLVVLLLATWQAAVPNAVRERILMTYDGQQVESSANERLQLWEDAFTIIPKHPIFGTGFATYRYLGRSADYLDTHNYYVKVVVETGFVGLIVFLYLLWSLAREGFRLFGSSQDPFFQRLGLGLTAMVITAALVNIFGDRWMYQQVTAYMWVALALVSRAGMLTEEAEQEVPPHPPKTIAALREVPA